MRETASADVWRLLALAGREPGAAHGDVFDALGLEASGKPADWCAAHTESFISQCVPYASIYLGDQGAIGGEAADRVAGFRRLLGPDTNEISGGVAGQPGDFLPDLLSDYAELTAMGDDPQACHAKKAMLWEHLLCWLMPYCDAMERAAPPPYNAWAALLRRVFLAEAETIGLPKQIPLQLRVAPPSKIDPAHHGLEEIVAGLLVPVRSGVVFTRRDFALVADRIGVPAVPGSRRFALRRLLEDRPDAALAELASMARTQALARAGEQHLLGDIAVFWSRRAAASLNTLDAMADRAQGSGSTTTQVQYGIRDQQHA